MKKLLFILVLLLIPSVMNAEKCKAPNVGYSKTECNLWQMTIYNNEPGATVSYQLIWNSWDDGTTTTKEGAFTGLSYTFLTAGVGQCTLFAVAILDGMEISNQGGVFFYSMEAPTYQRGDVNGSGTINMADLTDLINYLLTDDTSEIYLDMANCDWEYGVSMSDVTSLINYLLTDTWE